MYPLLEDLGQIAEKVNYMGSDHLSVKSITQHEVRPELEEEEVRDNMGPSITKNQKDSTLL